MNDQIPPQGAPDPTPPPLESPMDRTAWDGGLTWKEIIELLKFAGIVIALIGLVLNFRAQDRARYQQQIATQRHQESVFRASFGAVGNTYVKIQSKCAQKPYLDCYDTPLPKSKIRPLTWKEKFEQRTIYTEIINHFEQGYILMGKNSKKDEYWPGWELYIQRYLCRPAFVETWRDIGDTWGTTFQNYIDGQIKKINDPKSKRTCGKGPLGRVLDLDKNPVSKPARGAIPKSGSRKLLDFRELGQSHLNQLLPTTGL